jgi:hypothetical protein
MSMSRRRGRRGSARNTSASARCTPPAYATPPPFRVLQNSVFANSAKNSAAPGRSADRSVRERARQPAGSCSDAQAGVASDAASKRNTRLVVKHERDPSSVFFKDVWCDTQHGASGLVPPTQALFSATGGTTSCTGNSRYRCCWCSCSHRADRPRSPSR